MTAAGTYQTSRTATLVARRRWRRAGIVTILALVAGALVSAIENPASANPASASAHHATAQPAPGSFVALTPSRILDTRNGTGTAEGAVPARGTVDLTVAGVGGVPTSDVASVVLNVTVTDTTAPGYLTVYPAGQSRPITSDVNYVVGQSRAHTSIARLGTGGRVEFYNGSTGTAQVIADVSGYFVTGASAQNGAFTPLNPSRVLDTRIAPQIPVQRYGTKSVPVAGHGGVPTGFAGTVLVNLTATQAQSAGYIRILDAESSVNFQAGRTNSNLVLAPLLSTGTIELTNISPGTVDLVADVVGYFSAGAPNRAGFLSSLLATRLLDTRSTHQTVPARGSIDVTVTDAVGVPDGISAAALDLVVAAPTAGGYLTAYPQGIARPETSSLSFDQSTVANLSLVPVAGNGEVTIFNGSSQPVNLVVDVSGYIGAVPGTLNWSAPQTVTSSPITALSCSRPTFCLAIDQSNQVHRFDGTSWVAVASIAPAAEDNIYASMSCVSPTFCVAVAAGESTAYVWRGHSWSAAPDRVDGETVNEVSCATTTFCVGVTFRGGGDGEQVATFNGSSWSASQSIFARGQNLSDVTCLSNDFCLVLGAYSNTVARWNGTDWTESAQLLPTSDHLSEVSCASVTFCAAAAYDSDVYFNGTTWSAPDPNPGTSLTHEHIACPSDTLCLQGMALTALRVDGTWTKAFRLSPLDEADEIDGYACPSAQLCLAYGGEMVYVGTARPA